MGWSVPTVVKKINSTVRSPPEYSFNGQGQQKEHQRKQQMLASEASAKMKQLHPSKEDKQEQQELVEIEESQMEMDKKHTEQQDDLEQQQQQRACQQQQDEIGNAVLQKKLERGGPRLAMTMECYQKLQQQSLHQDQEKPLQHAEVASNLHSMHDERSTSQVQNACAHSSQSNKEFISLVPGISDDEGQGDEAEGVTEPDLQSLLGELASESAMQDKNNIPDIARQIWARHISTASIGSMLDVLADAMMDPSIKWSHRLAIFYVYHEWLIQAPEVQRQFALVEGIHRFLEPISRTIRNLPSNEAQPYLMTLSVWHHLKFYSSHFIDQVRSFWTKEQHLESAGFNLCDDGILDAAVSAEPAQPTSNLPSRPSWYLEFCGTQGSPEPSRPSWYLEFCGTQDSLDATPMVIQID
eukprot:gnl/MRDRNA2_/MRDRNA2_70932_c0_seq2.p1 gnl/MRDRNA2_/MRDRNA2_70932_c0~~gnl/MRDRNA2_/MRDRNA2_70932_c0_seq2.p1  ORF type:complete len:411 (-),score=99.70 gnl/MRDRNA2_/MRDRNA2_70932_c0_seq2:189-1421(-)